MFSTIGKLILILVSVFLIIFLYRFKKMGEESEKINPILGIENGALKPCGAKPNCASSTHPDEKFRVETLNFTLGPDLVRKNLEEIFNSEKIQIVKSDGNYIYGLHRSKLWGFVDDVEVLIDAEKKQIYFRSASRVGYSDLGVNKKRLGLIISKFKVLNL